MGTVNIQKCIADLQSIIISVADIIEHKGGANLPQDILALTAAISDAVSCSIAAWPELQNLSEQDAEDLGKAAFDMVKAVIAKIKDKSIPAKVPPSGGHGGHGGHIEHGGHVPARGGGHHE
jgi:hypothetical protein